MSPETSKLGHPVEENLTQIKSVSDLLGHPIDSAKDWDALHEGLNKATSAAECVEVAKKYGFNFSEQEFQDYFEEHLTPEQLEAVGAGNCCCSSCSSC